MDKNSSKTATTRVFKSGNSQAVRIPAEMAFENTEGDFTITRSGDVITIYRKTARQSVEEMFAKLRALPAASMLQQVDRIELPDRDWD
jgi:antitoxin VapB